MPAALGLGHAQPLAPCPTGGIVIVEYLLLEDDDNILLENNDKVRTQNG